MAEDGKMRYVVGRGVVGNPAIRCTLEIALIAGRLTVHRENYE